MQSVAITTKDVSSNTAHVEVYSIHHYVLKFFSDLGQVDGFHRVPRWRPPNKAGHHEIANTLLQVELNKITLSFSIAKFSFISSKAKSSQFIKLLKEEWDKYTKLTYMHQITAIYIILSDK